MRHANDPQDVEAPCLRPVFRDCACCQHFLVDVDSIPGEGLVRRARQPKRKRLTLAVAL